MGEPEHQCSPSGSSARSRGVLTRGSARPAGLPQLEEHVLLIGCKATRLGLVVLGQEMAGIFFAWDHSADVPETGSDYCQHCGRRTRLNTKIGIG